MRLEICEAPHRYFLKLSWEMVPATWTQRTLVTGLMSEWKVAAGDQNNPEQLCDPQVFCILLFTRWGGWVLRFVVACGQTGTPMVSSYGTQPTVAAGAAFPFFIKKRKQEIECKTLWRLVSNRSCELNHTPARKWKYSSHSLVPSPFLAHMVFFRF